MVSGLAAGGALPLLGADAPKKRQPRGKKRGGRVAGTNIFTEPSAIQPINGYLSKFKPIQKGGMTGDFSAKYSLVQCAGGATRSKNSINGSMDVSFSGKTCKTLETRVGRPSNTIETELACKGKLNIATKWTLRSSITGLKDIQFTEQGTCDGKTMTVKSKSWTQELSPANALIARWALLQLVASGSIKSKPLNFDMLDDSSLRPSQTIKYCGQIEIPVAGGKAKLDCYSQIGDAIVPTHYLVDSRGIVQLITQDYVNWALTAL